jgi:CIC family chloride channel protein
MNVALDNYHVTYAHEGDDPQPRYDRPAFGLALRKGVMTLLTVGGGASGGIEAPTVVISEGLAAGIARVMQVRSEYELRTYQLAAISSAVATLLGAPFTAALFATEVAYGDRIIYRKLAYCMWAAVLAYLLNNRLHGYTPLFPSPEHGATYSGPEYLATALVAIAVSTPAAVAFGFAMTSTRRLVERVRPELHGAITGLLTAAVALAVWALGVSPVHVLTSGEETVHALVTDDPTLASGGVLALVLAGRLLTTALTQSGGGSAGLLVPSMVVGALCGAITAHALTATGLLALDPALFAVVGLASALVAVVGVPLAAIALVLEVFGSAYGPPAILACGMTYLLTLKFTLYEAQRASPDPEADETG